MIVFFSPFWLHNVWQSPTKPLFFFSLKFLLQLMNIWFLSSLKMVFLSVFAFGVPAVILVPLQPFLEIVAL